MIERRMKVLSHILYLVIPCYNEEEVLYETASQLLALTDSMIRENLISPDSRIAFVDDGSKDKTWQIIEELSERHVRVTGIKLAKNAGHQNALLAGMMTVRERADMIVSADADLQDDISIIRDFVIQYNNGNDVVYGVRSSRDTDSFFKRNTALLFYKMMRALGVDIVYNHADYRLMSRRAVDALSEFNEVNLFLRGLVPLVGFPSATVSYERKERFAGTSKYPLKKMLKFAFEGITSFSIKPIRLITGTGAMISFFSILAAVYALISKIAGVTVPGWTSLMLSIWFIGGVQLLSLGLIGEYVGKVYQEAKHRPRYIIEKTLD